MTLSDSRLNYLIIVGVVVLANLVAVINLDILIQDDNSRYMTVVQMDIIMIILGDHSSV